MCRMPTRCELARRAFLLALLLLSQSGCAGFGAHLMYWIKGYKVDARCTALEGKKVAVVCVTGDRVEGIGLSNEGESICRVVSSLLEKNVKKVTVVRPEDVSDWRDKNSWDEIDYRAIGRGLKADMVLAIDLASFTLHEDSTLLRGKANVKTTVYDVKDSGKIVFRDGPREFAFPENGGRHAVENETNFHRIFILMLSQNIAQNFYAYDKVDDFAKDAAFQSF